MLTTEDQRIKDEAFPSKKHENKINQKKMLDPEKQKKLALKKEQFEKDRLLRQEQENEYKEMQKIIAEQEKMKALEEKQKEEQKMRELEEINKKKNERILLKELKRNEAVKRLKREPNENEKGSIIIFFRLPSGERRNRRFFANENVQVITFCIDFKLFTF